MSARNWASCLLTSAAIALLLPHAAAQATTSPNRLQSLVNVTVVQLQVAYRQDPAERLDRYGQLEGVVERWRNAPRSEANDRLLAEWLRGAMRVSMPGSRAALPAVPAFIGGAADKSAGDPFGDDPLQD